MLTAYLATLKVGMCQHSTDEAGRKLAQDQPVGCPGLGHIPMALMEARCKQLHLRDALAVYALAPVHCVLCSRDILGLQVPGVPHPEICSYRTNFKILIHFRTAMVFNPLNLWTQAGGWVTGQRL